MDMVIVFSDVIKLWYDSVYFILFFFFKQKTAYEMRISDWSSDVCSSDLLAPRNVINGELAGTGKGFNAEGVAFVRDLHASIAIAKIGFSDDDGCKLFGGSREVEAVSADVDRDRVAFIDEAARAIVGRSEEHTSELQSLMRISYAAFCLKKKITI